MTDFEGKIRAVIDGGATEYGIESTVISLVAEPCLLRLGAVPKAQIEQVLGMSLGEATHQVSFHHRELATGIMLQKPASSFLPIRTIWKRI